jgi:hypothetical protein
MHVACVARAMLRASDRSSVVLAVAIALALGGLGLGASPALAQHNPMAGAAPAQAFPAVAVSSYRLRGRSPLVPSNGALPIVTFDGSHPVVTVTDPTGAVLTGLIHEVGLSDGGIVLAWVPSAPFMVGIHSVSLASPYDATRVQVESVRVIAPFPSGLPPIRVEASASLVVLPETRECCLGAPGGPPNGCFVTRHESYVSVEPGFTTPTPDALLNQYLFRLKPAPGSVPGGADEIFMPFEQVKAAGFYEPADEYCVQVETLNITTRMVDVYPLLACTTGVDALVGVLEVDVPDRQLAYEACPLPPDSQSAVWCGVNPNLCSRDNPDACAIHEHVCQGAPAPPIVSMLRSGEPASDAVLMRGGSQRRDLAKACTAAPGSRTNISLGGIVLLLAVALLARRRH